MKLVRSLVLGSVLTIAPIRFELATFKNIVSYNLAMAEPRQIEDPVKTIISKHKEDLVNAYLSDFPSNSEPADQKLQSMVRTVLNTKNPSALARSKPDIFGEYFINAVLEAKKELKLPESKMEKETPTKEAKKEVAKPSAKRTHNPKEDLSILETNGVDAFLATMDIKAKQPIDSVKDKRLPTILALFNTLYTERVHAYRNAEAPAVSLTSADKNAGKSIETFMAQITYPETGAFNGKFEDAKMNDKQFQAFVTLFQKYTISLRKQKSLTFDITPGIKTIEGKIDENTLKAFAQLYLDTKKIKPQEPKKVEPAREVTPDTIKREPNRDAGVTQDAEPKRLSDDTVNSLLSL